MDNYPTIGFIGAGNMAYALISGLIESGYSKNNIKASDPNKDLLSLRHDEFKLEIFTDNSKLTTACDVIVLAVKPQVLPSVCKAIKDNIGHKPLVISIAAGVRVNDINRWLGGKSSIVRVMPNTPALLGKGAAGIFANDSVSDAQKDLSKEILDSVGDCFWVDDEKLLDAVTALSGSGPAYFFLFIESMTKAGVALGLDEETAQKLSIQTALGASVMASNSKDISPRQLRSNVTSPNGTTQAAINSFHDQNFAMIVSHAMRAAFERSREMGNELGNDE
jgi:pyrroline-5-carboxylate reductase